jgi:hypothetical protein
MSFNIQEETMKYMGAFATFEHMYQLIQHEQILNGGSVLTPRSHFRLNGSHLRSIRTMVHTA